MIKRKRFIEKVSDRTIIIGLSSLAVLLALGDAAERILLSFPDRRTTIGQVWDQTIRHQSKTIRDYFEELKEISGYNLRVIIHRLEKKGLIQKTEKGFRLTYIGTVVSQSIRNKINYFTNWDGKWRLITFDIPEKRRKERKQLVKILKGYDYKPLHKSVFVGKFPLPEEVYRHLYNRRLSPYIRFLTITEVDEEL